MAANERWYFTKERILNSPSSRAGIDNDKELHYRQQAAGLIQDMGQRLQLSQLCINTAIVYMHRFYMFHSFTKFHRNNIAACALYLAAKVEEQPRKLEHVVNFAHLCTAQNSTPLDTKSEEYKELAQELIVMENILLQTLGFDVEIDHPHTLVVRYFASCRAPKELAQTSYFMATNSLHLTTMCLQYRPTVVACVSIHLACKWTKWEIPKSTEGKEWWYYIDQPEHTVTLDLLESLTTEFLAIYNKCPTRINCVMEGGYITEPKFTNKKETQNLRGKEHFKAREPSSARTHNKVPDDVRHSTLSGSLKDKTAPEQQAPLPLNKRKLGPDKYQQHREAKRRIEESGRPPGNSSGIGYKDPKRIRVEGERVASHPQVPSVSPYAAKKRIDAVEALSDKSKASINRWDNAKESQRIEHEKKKDMYEKHRKPDREPFIKQRKVQQENHRLMPEKVPVGRPMEKVKESSLKNNLDKGKGSEGLVKSREDRDYFDKIRPREGSRLRASQEKDGSMRPKDERDFDKIRELSSRMKDVREREGSSKPRDAQEREYFDKIREGVSRPRNLQEREGAWKQKNAQEREYFDRIREGSSRSRDAEGTQRPKERETFDKIRQRDESVRLRDPGLEAFDKIRDGSAKSRDSVDKESFSKSRDVYDRFSSKHGANLEKQHYGKSLNEDFRREEKTKERPSRERTEEKSKHFSAKSRDSLFEKHLEDTKDYAQKLAQQRRMDVVPEKLKEHIEARAISSSERLQEKVEKLTSEGKREKYKNKKQLEHRKSKLNSLSPSFLDEKIMVPPEKYLSPIGDSPENYGSGSSDAITSPHKSEPSKIKPFDSKPKDLQSEPSKSKPFDHKPKDLQSEPSKSKPFDHKSKDLQSEPSKSKPFDRKPKDLQSEPSKSKPFDRKPKDSQYEAFKSRPLDHKPKGLQPDPSKGKVFDPKSKDLQMDPSKGKLFDPKSKDLQVDPSKGKVFDPKSKDLQLEPSKSKPFDPKSKDLQPENKPPDPKSKTLLSSMPEFTSNPVFPKVVKSKTGLTDEVSSVKDHTFPTKVTHSKSRSKLDEFSIEDIIQPPKETKTDAASYVDPGKSIFSPLRDMISEPRKLEPKPLTSNEPSFTSLMSKMDEDVDFTSFFTSPKDIQESDVPKSSFSFDLSKSSNDQLSFLYDNKVDINEEKLDLKELTNPASSAKPADVSQLGVGTTSVTASLDQFLSFSQPSRDMSSSTIKGSASQVCKNEEAKGVITSSPAAAPSSFSLPNDIGIPPLVTTVGPSKTKPSITSFSSSESAPLQFTLDINAGSGLENSAGAPFQPKPTMPLGTESSVATTISLGSKDSESEFLVGKKQPILTFQSKPIMTTMPLGTESSVATTISLGSKDSESGFLVGKKQPILTFQSKPIMTTMPLGTESSVSTTMNSGSKENQLQPLNRMEMQRETGFLADTKQPILTFQPKQTVSPIPSSIGSSVSTTMNSRIKETELQPYNHMEMQSDPAFLADTKQPLLTFQPKPITSPIPSDIGCSVETTMNSGNKENDLQSQNRMQMQSDTGFKHPIVQTSSSSAEVPLFSQSMLVRQSTIVVPSKINDCVTQMPFTEKSGLPFSLTIKPDLQLSFPEKSTQLDFSEKPPQVSFADKSVQQLVSFAENSAPQQVSFPEKSSHQHVLFAEKSVQQQTLLSEKSVQQQALFSEKSAQPQVSFAEKSAQQQASFVEKSANQQSTFIEKSAQQQNPFAEKPAQQQNPIAEKSAQQQNPFAEKSAQQQTPFAEKSAQQQIPFAEKSAQQQIPFAEQSAQQQSHFAGKSAHQQIPFSGKPAHQHIPLPERSAHQHTPFTDIFSHQQSLFPEKSTSFGENSAIQFPFFDKTTSLSQLSETSTHQSSERSRQMSIPEKSSQIPLELPFTARDERHLTSLLHGNRFLTPSPLEDSRFLLPHYPSTTPSESRFLPPPPYAAHVPPIYSGSNHFPRPSVEVTPTVSQSSDRFRPHSSGGDRFLLHPSLGPTSSSSNSPYLQTHSRATATMSAESRLLQIASEPRSSPITPEFAGSAMTSPTTASSTKELFSSINDLSSLGVSGGARVSGTVSKSPVQYSLLTTGASMPPSSNSLPMMGGSGSEAWFPQLRSESVDTANKNKLEFVADKMQFPPVTQTLPRISDGSKLTENQWTPFNTTPPFEGAPAHMEPKPMVGSKYEEADSNEKEAEPPPKKQYFRGQSELGKSKENEAVSKITPQLPAKKRGRSEFDMLSQPPSNPVLPSLAQTIRTVPKKTQSFKEMSTSTEEVTKNEPPADVFHSSIEKDVLFPFSEVSSEKETSLPDIRQQEGPKEKHFNQEETLDNTASKETAPSSSIVEELSPEKDVFPAGTQENPEVFRVDAPDTSKEKLLDKRVISAINKEVKLSDKNEGEKQHGDKTPITQELVKRETDKVSIPMIEVSQEKQRFKLISKGARKAIETDVSLPLTRDDQPDNPESDENEELAKDNVKRGKKKTLPKVTQKTLKEKPLIKKERKSRNKVVSPVSEESVAPIVRKSSRKTRTSKRNKASTIEAVSSLAENPVSEDSQVEEPPSEEKDRDSTPIEKYKVITSDMKMKIVTVPDKKPSPQTFEGKDGEDTTSCIPKVKLPSRKSQKRGKRKNVTSIQDEHVDIESFIPTENRLNEGSEEEEPMVDVEDLSVPIWPEVPKLLPDNVSEVKSRSPHKRKMENKHPKKKKKKKEKHKKKDKEHHQHNRHYKEKKKKQKDKAHIKITIQKNVLPEIETPKKEKIKKLKLKRSNEEDESAVAGPSQEQPSGPLKFVIQMGKDGTKIKKRKKNEHQKWQTS